MNKTNLIEDAEDDLRRSSMAYEFVNKLVSHLYQMKKNARSLPTWNINGDTLLPGALSDDFGFDHGFFKGILVCFEHSDYPGTNGMVSPTTNGSIRFVIKMEADTEDIGAITASVMNNMGRTVLMHELAHVIDMRRWRAKDQLGNRPVQISKAKMKAATTDEERSKLSREHMNIYHNDTLEQNAFFHNMAEPLLARIRLLRDQPLAHGLFDPITRDFREYFEDELNKKYGIVKQHWDHVDQRGKRRVIARLNSLFELYWKMDDAHDKYSQENSEVA